MRVFLSLWGAAMVLAAPLWAERSEQEIEADLDAIVAKKTEATPAAKPAEKKVSPAVTADVETKPEVKDKIVLPANPTKAEVEAYLKALSATQGRVEFRTNIGGKLVVREPSSSHYSMEKIREKLAAVPSSYLEQMLDYAKDRRATSRYRVEIITSINKRTDLAESQRELIVKSLRACPGLITTMVHYGWHEREEARVLSAVRGALKDRLAAGSGVTVPIEKFIPVLVEYGTADSQKMIKEVLTGRLSANELRDCFKALPDGDVPGVDRVAIVETVWKEVVNNTGLLGERLDWYAVIAATYGQKDALVYMANKLRTSVSPVMGGAQRAMLQHAQDNFGGSLPQLVPDGGKTEAELIAYVLANQAKLTYDKTLKQYRVK